MVYSLPGVIFRLTQWILRHITAHPDTCGLPSVCWCLSALQSLVLIILQSVGSRDSKIHKTQHNYHHNWLIKIQNVLRLYMRKSIKLFKLAALEKMHRNYLSLLQHHYFLDLWLLLRISALLDMADLCSQGLTVIDRTKLSWTRFHTVTSAKTEHLLCHHSTIFHFR